MDGEIDDSLAQALELLGESLRRNSDRDVRDALRAQVFALAGYGPKEIRDRMGVSREDFRFLKDKLRRAFRTMDRDDEE